MHQPDNMDAGIDSRMVQEDTSQAPNSRIWRYDFDARAWSIVASVNDRLWEPSGIVDASAVSATARGPSTSRRTARRTGSTAWSSAA